MDIKRNFEFAECELLESAPRCLWIGVDGDRNLIGWRDDGFVYLLANVLQSERKKERQSWKTIWMSNQSWWCTKRNDQEALDYFLNKMPNWLDLSLAAKVINSSYEDFQKITPINDGRYIEKVRGGIATNQRDMVWMLDTFATVEGVIYTPDVQLLYDNCESRFGGHPLQIWSDGLWSRGELLSGSKKKTVIHKDAETILKFIKKEMALQIGVDNLLSIDWCIKTEIAISSTDIRSVGGSYSEEYKMEQWDTNRGTFYMLFFSWGALNEDGDCGDNCDVYLSLDEIKAAYKTQIDENQAKT